MTKIAYKLKKLTRKSVVECTRSTPPGNSTQRSEHFSRDTYSNAERVLVISAWCRLSNWEMLLRQASSPNNNSSSSRHSLLMALSQRLSRAQESIPPTTTRVQCSMPQQWLSQGVSAWPISSNNQHPLQQQHLSRRIEERRWRLQHSLSRQRVQVLLPAISRCERVCQRAACEGI